MSKDNWIGILVLLVIIFIGITGGFRKNQNNGLISGNSRTPVQKIPDNKETIAKGTILQNKSEYYGQIKIYYVVNSSNPDEEYLTLKLEEGAGTIDITGWTLRSDYSGEGVTIPQGTYLYFKGIQNGVDDIRVTGGEYVYLITGKSPVGYSFKINKCSGYLNQSIKFNPRINNDCPTPIKENMSGIPKTVANDECIRYIESFPRCKVQTENLPVEWTTECKQFILDKLNYPSCVNIHKNDSDFYGVEWLVYLNKGNPLWHISRENVTLYDRNGKAVSTYTTY